jgi:hypothetical protein
VSTWPDEPRVRLTVFPTRVSPPLKVKRSVNCPLRLLYPIQFDHESDVSEIFDDTVPERERKLLVRVLTLPERLKRVPESERIFPVEVARALERARMFPVAVAR